MTRTQQTESPPVTRATPPAGGPGMHKPGASPHGSSSSAARQWARGSVPTPPAEISSRRLDGESFGQSQPGGGYGSESNFLCKSSTLPAGVGLLTEERMLLTPQARIQTARTTSTQSSGPPRIVEEWAPIRYDLDVAQWAWEVQKEDGFFAVTPKKETQKEVADAGVKNFDHALTALMKQKEMVGIVPGLKNRVLERVMNEDEVKGGLCHYDQPLPGAASPGTVTRKVQAGIIEDLYGWIEETALPQMSTARESEQDHDQVMRDKDRQITQSEMQTQRALHELQNRNMENGALKRRIADLEKSVEGYKELLERQRTKSNGIAASQMATYDEEFQAVLKRLAASREEVTNLKDEVVQLESTLRDSNKWLDELESECAREKQLSRKFKKSFHESQESLCELRKLYEEQSQALKQHQDKLLSTSNLTSPSVGRGGRSPAFEISVIDPKGVTPMKRLRVFQSNSMGTSAVTSSSSGSARSRHLGGGVQIHCLAEDLSYQFDTDEPLEYTYCSSDDHPAEDEALHPYGDIPVPSKFVMKTVPCIPREPECPKLQQSTSIAVIGVSPQPHSPPKRTISIAAIGVSPQPHSPPKHTIVSALQSISIAEEAHSEVQAPVQQPPPQDLNLVKAAVAFQLHKGLLANSPKSLRKFRFGAIRPKVKGKAKTIKFVEAQSPEKKRAPITGGFKNILKGFRKYEQENPGAVIPTEKEAKLLSNRAKTKWKMKRANMSDKTLKKGRGPRKGSSKRTSPGRGPDSKAGAQKTDSSGDVVQKKNT